MITKLGIYAAKISSPNVSFEGSDDGTVDDTFFSHLFLFKSDDDAVSTLNEAACGDVPVDIHAIYRLGYFDPFNGVVSDLDRKEVFVCEKTVDAAQ